jgi:hypothetical protein
MSQHIRYSMACSQYNDFLNQSSAADAIATQTSLRCSYVEVTATNIIQSTSLSGWPLRNIRISNDNGYILNPCYVPVLHVFPLYPRWHPPAGHVPLIGSHVWLTQWQFPEHWFPNVPDGHATKWMYVLSILDKRYLYIIGVSFSSAGFLKLDLKSICIDVPPHFRMFSVYDILKL